MLTTEAEAKTKRCHEGYAASPGASVNPLTDFVHQTSVAPPAMHSVGAGYGAAITTMAAAATAPIFCLGTACMAWRWRGWTNEGPDGPDHRLTNRNPTQGHPDYHRYGYCGKAGRP